MVPSDPPELEPADGTGDPDGELPEEELEQAAPTNPSTASTAMRPNIRERIEASFGRGRTEVLRAGGPCGLPGPPGRARASCLYSKVVSGEPKTQWRELFHEGVASGLW